MPHNRARSRRCTGARVQAQRRRELRDERLSGFNLDARAAAGGLVTFAEMQLVIPKHRVWFYRNEKAGLFPKRRRLGASVFWDASEVRNFIAR